MERRLTDADTYPSQEVVSGLLGRAMPAWVRFDAIIEAAALEAEWRYYRDGGAWLRRVTVKGKTLCWVSIAEGRFHVGFYLGGKATDKLLGRDLPEPLKDRIRQGKQIGKLRAVSFEIAREDDLATLEPMMRAKLGL